MKNMKAFCSTLALAAGLTLFFGPGAAKAQAAAQTAAPASYAVQYDEDKNGWVYQPAQQGGGFDESLPSSDVYYLIGLYLKDGDTIVIHNDSGKDGSSIPMLDFGGVHLANLTYAGPSWAVVKADSVDELYVLGGTGGTFNGSVQNAYVYDTSVFNFNGDVVNLTIGGLTRETGPKSSLGCTGTVHHFYAPADGRTYYDIYDVASGQFYLKEGALHTPDYYYTLSTQYVPPVPAQTPAQTTDPAPAAEPASEPAPQTAAQPAAADSEYDDVPKTGQSVLVWYLLGASVLLFTAGQALWRFSR